MDYIGLLPPEKRGRKGVKRLLKDLDRSLRRVRTENLDVCEVYGATRKALHATRPAIVGSAFACPVCGGRFRRFLPFGLNGRRNARCPGCGSLERHRFMWMHLRDRHRPMQRRLRLLHIAPE